MNRQEVNFITKNKRKLYRAKEIFKKEGVSVNQISIDTIEIQANDTEQVVRHSLKEFGRKLNKTIILEDVGFYITSLNGFPGPYIKYINNWFNPNHILLLMNNQKNRTCYRESCLGVYDSSKESVGVFIAREYGKISYTIKGESLYPIDKIFIPKEYNKTRAELTEKEILETTNLENWRSLINYIKKNG